MVKVDAPPTKERRLFEIWYVFPTRRGKPVRTLVRQAYGAELTLHADAFDVLDYQVDALLPPRYPEAALSQDTTLTTCTVDLDVGADLQAARVEVSGCDEVFREPSRRSARGWVLSQATLEGTSLVTGLTYDIRFERALNGKSGSAYLMLPEAPDLGQRARVVTTTESKEPPKRPEPTGDPVLLVDHGSYAEVSIHEIVWPDGQAGKRIAPVKC